MAIRLRFAFCRRNRCPPVVRRDVACLFAAVLLAQKDSKGRTSLDWSRAALPGGVVFLFFFSAALAAILGSPWAGRAMILDAVYGVLPGSAVAITFGYLAGVPVRVRRVLQ
jgi:hypothetical protein